MEVKAPKMSAKKLWAERLRGRSRMAVAAIGGVFLVGFLGVSRPLGQRIDAANERLDTAVGRAVLGSDVYDLRQQASLYHEKLPRNIDLNDWTNYLLSGFRTQKVKLVRMDPREQLSLGPCKILTWQIELQGDFESLSRVVEWLENGTRLVRIDRLSFQSPSGQLNMQILVKGLAINAPMDRSKTPGSPSTAPALSIKETRSLP